jgi:hypothetical protein
MKLRSVLQTKFHFLNFQNKRSFFVLESGTRGDGFVNSEKILAVPAGTVDKMQHL